MPTKIEWTEETWNPVTGCTKVSPGCAHCYAERMAKRLAGRYGYPADEPFRVTLHPDRLDQPLHWTKPQRVFVCSMADLFHDTVPYTFIDQIFQSMALADYRLNGTQHIWQILTKRPQRMLHYMSSGCFGGQGQNAYGWPLSGVWLGVTAEDQKYADERIPLLLQTPSITRFISAEPLLEPLYLLPYLKLWEGIPDTLDWVIVGCESGPNRRPMELKWALDVVYQCKNAGVAVFVKQLDIDGRVSKDPQEWPNELRVREYPQS